ncbi:hypothetical protein NPIL_417121 [Nephila pilipes]|uniref:Uncharacterized protein n=1 Tax=Nephila pilipes TaxID=299642 RepID=A0A8X6QQY4_NEPPI|nr:hypothetical protein NPIL_417121 [Nephila pilipes]
MFFDTVARFSDDNGTREGTPRGGELARLDSERTLRSTHAIRNDRLLSNVKNHIGVVLKSARAVHECLGISRLTLASLPVRRGTFVFSKWVLMMTRTGNGSWGPKRESCPTPETSRVVARCGSFACHTENTDRILDTFRNQSAQLQKRS